MQAKKLTALLLAAVLAATALLAGCSDAADNSTTSTAGDADKTYNVGIVQLVQHPALDEATKGFQDALTDKLGDKVKFDYQNAQDDTNTCATIANTFVSNKVDLIMANATPALQAAQAATNEIPVLGTSITDYATALGVKEGWTGKTGTNISGTSDLAPLDKQAEMVKELFPDAKNVGLLYCSAEPNSLYQIGVIQPLLEGMGYTCKAYSFADSNDISSVVTTACNESDVLYIPTDNTAAKSTELINNIAEPAGVPIVAGEEGICKGCGVATLSISYYELGKATGEMAYEILVNGAKPGDMEIRTAPNTSKLYFKTRADKLKVTIPDGYEAISEEAE